MRHRSPHLGSPAVWGDFKPIQGNGVKETFTHTRQRCVPRAQPWWLASKPGGALARIRLPVPVTWARHPPTLASGSSRVKGENTQIGSVAIIFSLFNRVCSGSEPRRAQLDSKQHNFLPSVDDTHEQMWSISRRRGWEGATGPREDRWRVLNCESD